MQLLNPGFNEQMLKDCSSWNSQQHWQQGALTKDAAKENAGRGRTPLSATHGIWKNKPLKISSFQNRGTSQYRPLSYWIHMFYSTRPAAAVLSIQPAMCWMASALWFYSGLRLTSNNWRLTLRRLRTQAKTEKTINRHHQPRHCRMKEKVSAHRKRLSTGQTIVIFRQHPLLRLPQAADPDRRHSSAGSAVPKAWRTSGSILSSHLFHWESHC